MPRMDGSGPRGSGTARGYGRGMCDGTGRRCRYGQRYGAGMGRRAGACRRGEAGQRTVQALEAHE